MMTMIVVVIKDNKEKDINCIGWNKKTGSPQTVHVQKSG